jgi:Secretion system C-terminal sorting domain
MYLDSNKLYAASSSGLYRSTNNGFNWVFIISSPPTTSIECVYASQGNIYFGTSRRGLFVSHDDGNTWGVLSGTSGITSIENVNEYIFYSTHNTHSAPSGSVHRSSDNGLTWLDVPIPNSPRPQTVKLQRHNGNIFGISKDKLYKSTDFGLNWIKYQATFEDSAFTSLHSDKGILYCGTSTSGGKYYLRYSTDNGLSFSKLGDSLPAEVTNIAVRGNYIYEGVKYYSVWRFFKPVITAENNEAGMLPATFSLKQNYPNPFNPTTKIKYDVARLGNVKIVIYDVTGREVQTLVNESLKPGTYEAAFDGSLLTSGVYFYKLITDGFTETKKMLLIK